MAPEPRAAGWVDALMVARDDTTKRAWAEPATAASYSQSGTSG